jgi:hypothetical protein
VADGARNAAKKKTRSGSETRERSPRVYARVTAQELVKIEMDAAAHALSVGGYLRWLALENPQTRATRRPLPPEILLRQLKAEAGRVDGNLAQFLKLANRGEPVPLDAIAGAANAVRDFFVHALERMRGA